MTEQEEKIRTEFLNYVEAFSPSMELSWEVANKNALECVRIAKDFASESNKALTEEIRQLKEVNEQLKKDLYEADTVSGALIEEIKVLKSKLEVAKETLNSCDEILTHLEDFTHGSVGSDITKTRHKIIETLSQITDTK